MTALMKLSVCFGSQSERMEVSSILPPVGIEIVSLPTLYNAACYDPIPSTQPLILLRSCRRDTLCLAAGVTLLK